MPLTRSSNQQMEQDSQTITPPVAHRYTISQLEKIGRQTTFQPSIFKFSLDALQGPFLPITCLIRLVPLIFDNLD